MTAIHIADTGLFVAMGQPPNLRYQAVRTFARQNDKTFVLPGRVYDELTAEVDGVDTPPIDTAIEEGWARVAAPLDYSLGLVSRTMDGVQRYIANGNPAALPVPVVLAGSGDVHGTSRRELGRRRLPVTETISSFLSPPGCRLCG